jgi:hypothetical protein
MQELIERISTLYDKAYHGQDIQFPDWHIQKELCDVLLMCKDELKKMDAVVSDMKSLSNDKSLCSICKFENCALSDTICADCKGYPYIVVDNFEWRGTED